MANTSSHLRQWAHNRSFIPLIPRSFTDWIVTVTFYTALHAIDALLVADKVPGIVSHAARNDVLMRTNRYANLAKRFLPLYDLSQTVRCLADPGKWIPFECVEREVFGRYLYPIEQSVSRLLKSSELTSEPIRLDQTEKSKDTVSGSGG